MATMAKWGSKKWVVNSKQITALEGLKFSYTQVADGSDKKTTTADKRGKELFPLTFSMVLHSGAGVDVRSEIESWEKLVTQVNYFYLGGKKLGPLLQLRKVSVDETRLDDFGRIRLAKISFEFKEYDLATTSVVVNPSTLLVNTDASVKAQKKKTNTAVKKAEKKTVKVGDYVRPTGKKYATGQPIPIWVKQRKHKVSQIKGNRVLLGYPSGIRSWVYLSEVTLVS